MTVYRYRLTDPSLHKLSHEVPGPLVITTLPSGLRVCIDAPPDSLPDLNECMERYGYEPDASLPVASLATSKLVDDVALTADWSVLGGVVAWPSSFFGDLSRLTIQVVGAYEADGDVQVRLKQNGVVISAEPTLPLSALTSFSFNAPVDAQPARSIYTLEGRLVTATTARVAYTSVGVLLLPG